MIRFNRLNQVTLHTSDGEPFTVYREEPEVPRIDDRFLDCSIYLYPTEEKALNGEQSGGSGFLAAVPAFGRGWMLDGRCPQSDAHHCYAISNKHVAKKHPVVRLNRDRSIASESHFSVFPFTVADWTFSQDHDIAVAPIDYLSGHKYLFISVESFLTEEKAAENDVGIGDEVFLVGRFINHEGRQRNNPSVRWGQLSMMPVEVVDDPEQPQEREQGFVIETHSISGYSGSPVFVRPFPGAKLSSYSGPIVDDRRGGNTVMYSFGSVTINNVEPGPFLLGIQKAYIHFIDPRDGLRKNTGMSCVVPAWHILDLLNSEKLQQQRKLEQERLKARHEQRGITETATPIHQEGEP